MIVAPLFVLNGQELPDPDYNRFYAAFNAEGKLVGFMTVALLPHCEPTWISQDYREQGVWEKLAEGVRERCKGTVLYCQVPDERTRHMVEKFGLTRVGEAYAGRM